MCYSRSMRQLWGLRLRSEPHLGLSNPLSEYKVGKYHKNSGDPPKVTFLATPTVGVYDSLIGIKNMYF